MRLWLPHGVTDDAVSVLYRARGSSIEGGVQAPPPPVVSVPSGYRPTRAAYPNVSINGRLTKQAETDVVVLTAGDKRGAASQRALATAFGVSPQNVTHGIAAQLMVDVAAQNLKWFAATPLGAGERMECPLSYSVGSQSDW